MNPQHAHWFILAIVNIPVYLGLGRLIFQDWAGFFETLRLWSDMDWIANIQKEWREDRWGTGKLPAFLLICVLLLVCEHLMVAKTAVKTGTQAMGL